MSASEEDSDDDPALADLRGLFDDAPLVSKSAENEEYRLKITSNGKEIEIVVKQAISLRKNGLDGVSEGTEAISATGAVIWTPSVVLSKYLSSREEGAWKGKRIFELGAGCGLCSITLAMLGAHVIGTDRSQMLPQLQHNVDANSASMSGSMRVSEYVWGEPEPPKHDADLDLIVCSDCVYDVHLVKPLVDSLKLLASAKTTIYVGNDESIGRDLAYQHFLEYAALSFDISLVQKDGFDPAFDRDCVIIYRLALKE